MAAEIIDGKAIAALLRARIGEETAAFVRETGVTPHLAAVLVGDDPASAIYVRNKQRACEQAGLKSTLHRLDATTSQSELLSLVDRLNADPDVHGILVQLPLPEHID
ncbi:MAG: bifunctional 5,10-methylene-tetrahydrofolate dehydrogenase/5,10-methylene-tetrahydrofolate cyclohydrolase, partial [Planctomycetaceae bacterium]|nr:bifunctional 5,10-methylene-tetrahydrofolate dehydrogenase/5,10-methylene-tetrahydrofolate cyclohydrolase [Planctomycetaceae bacterium]